MLTQLRPGLFQLDVPLRNNPLKSLNCYILKGEESLMIDSGFNTPENKEILLEALKELGIAPQRLRLFLTHLHSDHTGLAAELEDEGVRVYMGKTDAGFLRDSLREDSPYWKQLEEEAVLQGLAEDGLTIERHPGYVFRPTRSPALHPARVGDVFTAGAYRLEVLDLPGHTPGLQALFEREKGLLFSSDHILETITPNITYWGEQHGDCLGRYLDNLALVRRLPVRQVYSAHRRLPEDHHRRIAELEAHHAHRLQECLDILGSGRASVREVTRRLHWDIRAKDWDDFPKSQKWFAAGEAHAHLLHLRERGAVKETLEDGILLYARSASL